jgi:molybdenum cofactor guanylyltransferase
MLSGVILAGGKNRNLKGSSKALLSFSGELLIERQIREMRLLCREIIVVTNEPRTLLPILGSSVRIITDFFPGKGALAGLHAALSLATFSQAWVVSSDMPFISADAANVLCKRKLAVDTDAIITSLENEYVPCFGIYDRRCRDSAAALLQKSETRLPELLKYIHWEAVSESMAAEQGIRPGYSWRISTVEDYEDALAQLTRTVG